MKTPDRRVLKLLPRLGEAFAWHWRQINRVLPPNEPLLVLEDVDLVAFEQLLKGLKASVIDTRAQHQELRLVRAAYATERKALHARFRWLQQMTRAYHAGSIWEKAMPLAPSSGDGHEVCLKAMQKGAVHWLKLAAEPVPTPGAALVAPDGFTVADFAAAVHSLAAGWVAVGRAEFEWKFARSVMLTKQQRMLTIAAAYRPAAHSRLTADHLLTRQIPRVWPKRRQVRSA